MVRCLFILALALLIAACSPVSEEVLRERQAKEQFFASLKVVRICKVDEDSFGKFIQRDAKGRLWVTSYARPSEWDEIEDIAPGLKPEDVC